MMNKYIFTLLALSFVILSAAQSTITTEQAGYYIDNEIPYPEDVARVIDSNNVLTPFVGNWSAIFNGKNYVFNIVKTTLTNPYSDVTSDNLDISFTINDLAGNTLYSSTSAQFNSMKGRFLSTRGHYYLTLADPCGYDADVIIIADHSGQVNNGGLIDTSNFDQIMVYLYTIKELLNVPPVNCVSISEQFPDRTLMIFDRM